MPTVQGNYNTDLSVTDQTGTCIYRLSFDIDDPVVTQECPECPPKIDSIPVMSVVVGESFSVDVGASSDVGQVTFS